MPVPVDHMFFSSWELYLIISDKKHSGDSSVLRKKGCVSVHSTMLQIKIKSSFLSFLSPNLYPCFITFCKDHRKDRSSSSLAKVSTISSLDYSMMFQIHSIHKLTKGSLKFSCSHITTTKSFKTPNSPIESAKGA